MVFEPTIAFVTLMGFIFGGLYNIIYQPIIKEREGVLLKANKDYKKLLERSKSLSEKAKENFCKLYELEKELESIESNFKILFLGSTGLCISVLLYDVGGMLYDLWLIFSVVATSILFFSSLLFSIELYYIMSTHNDYVKYKNGKLLTL